MVFSPQEELNMHREDFLGFVPRNDEPLIIAFIDWIQDLGYSAEIAWDFWDFNVYGDEDDPLMIVRTVRNTITDPVLNRLVTSRVPMKVILLEGPTPNLDRLDAQKLFLATTGTGVYVRGVGWRTLPGTPIAGTVEDLQLKLARKWRQRDDGVWVKQCSKCGVEKGTNDFYRSAYRTARDPYRNLCIPCFNGRSPTDASQAAH
jgi:hypothetical protein